MTHTRSTPQSDSADHTLRNSLLVAGGVVFAGVASGGIAVAAGLICEAAIGIGAGVATLVGLAKGAYDFISTEMEASDRQLQEMADTNAKLQKELQQVKGERTNMSTHLRVLQSQKDGYRIETEFLKTEKQNLEHALANKIVNDQQIQIAKYDAEEAKTISFAPTRPR